MPIENIIKIADYYDIKYGFSKTSANIAKFNSILSGIDRFLKFAVDPIATNRTKVESLPENFYSPEDIDLDRYKEKTYELYYRDIYDAHFERYRRLFEKEAFEKYKKFYEQQVLQSGTPVKNLDKIRQEARRKAQDRVREEDDLISAKAERKIKEITSKQRNKSIHSHSEFLRLLKEMGVKPGDKVVAPGSGAGDEQVLAPDLNWRGLEYQQNLVDIANQRNKQMGLGSLTEQWSFLNIDPTMPLTENWQDNINTISDSSGKPIAIYAKHACGGLTDGSLFRAVQDKIPIIFLATCCANRYTEVSWRVLDPKNEDGTPMTFEEYKDLAYKSQDRQSQVGREFVDKIDSFREDFLRKHGYNVTRGTTSFGPYIKAWLAGYAG